MQYSNFSRATSGLAITFTNEVPIEDVRSIRFFRDDAAGTFSKKEFRWSFNYEYWSSWETLTQAAICSVDIRSNKYFFLQAKYTLTTATSGTVTSFVLTYDSETVPSTATSSADAPTADSSLLNGYAGSYYLARSHHTGTQSIATVTGLQAVLDAKQATIPGGTYVKEASLGADLYFQYGLLEVSIGSIAGDYATNTSVGLTVNAINASIGELRAADLAFATNASVGIALEPYATNSSVNLAVETVDASIEELRTADLAFATNASVGLAL